MIIETINAMRKAMRDQQNIDVAGVRVTQNVFDKLMDELERPQDRGKKYAQVDNMHVVVFQEN